MTINKKRMFEINDFLNSNSSKTNDFKLGDVKFINNLKTPALLKAQSRINTQEDFKQAFEDWFGNLGVANEFKDNFNSTTAINHIREIFKNFGIKP